MKLRLAFFTILSVLLFIASDSQALDTMAIDNIRKKNVLNDEDLQIIDDFIANAVRELVESTDFTSIAKARTVITSRKSNQAQYAEQFSKSTQKYISQALRQSEEIASSNHKLKVKMNLLILIDNLHDPRLIDLALGELDGENRAIRYWTVHAVTNPSLIEKIKSDGSGDLKLVRKIAVEISKLVEKACPEVLSMIADFAASVDTLESEELLLKIADMRMNKYINWELENYLLDAKILKLLCGKILSETPAKAAVVRRFAQLYSYAIQRYIKGLKDNDFPDEIGQQQLASVLVEVEDKCIGKLTGLQQGVMKKGVEQGDYNGLFVEHSRLLGDETRPGILQEKYKFNYGSDDSGNKLTAPLILSERPEITEK